MRITYEDVPMEFALKHRAECEAECDRETPLTCYCGKLATGFHTANCRRYQKKLQAKITARYRAALKPMKGMKISAGFMGAFAVLYETVVRGTK